jgi:hypothetical protein
MREEQEDDEETCDSNKLLCVSVRVLVVCSRGKLKNEEF